MRVVKSKDNTNDEAPRSHTTTTRMRSSKSVTWSEGELLLDRACHGGDGAAEEERDEAVVRVDAEHRHYTGEGRGEGERERGGEKSGGKFKC